MKYISVLLFSILSANSFSQKGFYLRPQLERKWHANPGHEYEVTTAQGFTVKVDPLNLYTGNGFDIGIHTGYISKNLFFEVGISQDGSNAGVRLIATSYSKNSNVYYLDDVYDNMGLAFIKYPLRVGIKLFGKEPIPFNSDKMIRWQGFLQGGVDFLKRQGRGGSVYGLTGWSHTFIPQEGDTLLYESFIASNVSNSYLLTLGFMLKGYNKKGRNVITFGIHYSQGKRRGQTTFNDITFTNYVDKKVYRSYVQSNCSGIYFNISKDIYPLNIFKKNKKSSHSIE